MNSKTFTPCGLYNIYNKQQRMSVLKERQDTGVLKACNICDQRNICKESVKNILQEKRDK